MRHYHIDINCEKCNRKIGTWSGGSMEEIEEELKTIQGFTGSETELCYGCLCNV